MSCTCQCCTQTRKYIVCRLNYYVSCLSELFCLNSVIGLVMHPSSGNCGISRRTVVCCAVQGNGMCKQNINILTGTMKSQILQICSSVMCFLNNFYFKVQVASIQRKPYLNLRRILLGMPKIWASNFLHFALGLRLVIFHTFQNYYKTSNLCSITLKFGSHNQHICRHIFLPGFDKCTGCYQDVVRPKKTGRAQMKIAITRVCVRQSGWNLLHVLGV